MKKLSEIMKVQVIMIVILCFNGSSICVGKREGLAYNYYEKTCPFVEEIVRKEMLAIFATDISSPPAFLRLLFHDCQVQGCDASILLQSRESEMQCSKNFGIRKLEEINRIKKVLEIMCPRKVSCADIIALTARDSVALSGGPFIKIPLGRKDSLNYYTPKQADANIPSPNISVDQFLHIFMAKGMDLQESVAILGAHTLGVGHCINIVDRLYNPKSTDKIDLGFELKLRLGCPSEIQLTNLTIIPNDMTSTIFDNQYFMDIIMGKGLFRIDSSISRDPRTMDIVNKFAFNQEFFFQIFASAFVKLSTSNVLTGNTGEVRLQCDQVNQ